jgi:hypothetical protein
MKLLLYETVLQKGSLKLSPIFDEANLLESVQVEAGRIITGLRVNSSRSKLYSELGWEPLYKRREKQKLILLYKIINGLTPDYNI